MADSFSIAFQVTPSGYTGTVEAFISATDQNVSIYPVKGSSSALTVAAKSGVIYPIKCKRIVPSANIVALNS